MTRALIDADALYWLHEYTAPNGCHFVRKRKSWRSAWCTTCNVQLGPSVQPGNATGQRYTQVYESRDFIAHVQKKEAT